jgi:hypothetical protein
MFISISGQDKAYLDFEARGVIDRCDASLVKMGNGGDETQAEPIAGTATTALKSIEA